MVASVNVKVNASMGSGRRAGIRVRTAGVYRLYLQLTQWDPATGAGIYHHCVVVRCVCLIGTASFRCQLGVS